MIAVPHYISPEEYLELERNSQHRHEYHYGLVYAMAGSPDNHTRLTFNILKAIDRCLGDTKCRFYSGNVTVHHQDEFYYYPDAFVTCDSRDKKDRHIKRHPKLIVEVLSKSTRKFNRGEKFTGYKTIATLEEYMLIE